MLTKGYERESKKNKCLEASRRRSKERKEGKDEQKEEKGKKYRWLGK